MKASSLDSGLVCVPVLLQIIFVRKSVYFHDVSSCYSSLVRKCYLPSGINIHSCADDTEVYLSVKPEEPEQSVSSERN